MKIRFTSRKLFVICYYFKKCTTIHLTWMLSFLVFKRSLLAHFEYEKIFWRSWVKITKCSECLKDARFKKFQVKCWNFETAAMNYKYCYLFQVLSFSKCICTYWMSYRMSDSLNSGFLFSIFYFQISELRNSEILIKIKISS